MSLYLTITRGRDVIPIRAEYSGPKLVAVVRLDTGRGFDFTATELQQIEEARRLTEWRAA
jgi:hypothetical protein